MALPIPSKILKANDLPGMPTANLSLRYFKFADIYNSKSEEFFKELDDGLKTNFLDFFTGIDGRPYHKAFALRRGNLTLIGDSFTMKTATRLVFGSGYNHPMEIGFFFDWTTGLPIIPGSSIKGAFLRYAKDNLAREKVQEIFGSPEKGTGSMVFFPAYPLEMNEPLFEKDWTTVHYKPYYENLDKPDGPDKPDIPPADYYSPVPLPFLAVRKNVTYEFRLALRMNYKAKIADSPLLKETYDLLKKALAESGVGAKTGINYGYFE